MRYYETSSRIAAAPGDVWSVLVDGSAWPDWDSGVEAVEGPVVLGGTVTVRSEAAKGRAFPVEVTEFRPAELLRFSGGMPLGLFRGVRTYTLSVAHDGTTDSTADATDFRMREEYTGPLLPLIWRTMPDLQPSFDRFARGLKARVESGG